MKVQGFSGNVWTALLVLGGQLSHNLPVVASVASAVSGLFALWAVYWLGRRLGLTRPMALAPPLLLATFGDFVFYMGSGLETGLLASNSRFASPARRSACRVGSGSR